jgi:hypothetical protein
MAQGMRQGTLVLFPNMNGKEEEKEGAACMAGKPILPVMYQIENKVKLCPRTSVNVSVKQNKKYRYRHSRYSRDDGLVSGSGVYKTSSDTTPVPCAIYHTQFTQVFQIWIQSLKDISEKKDNIS